MNKEVKELIEEIKGFGNCGFFTMTTEERDLLLDYINQLETNRDEVLDLIYSNVVSNGEVIDQLRKIEVKRLIEILERGKE